MMTEYEAPVKRRERRAAREWWATATEDEQRKVLMELTPYERHRLEWSGAIFGKSVVDTALAIGLRRLRRKEAA
jgi:hypothetical protein